MAETTENTGLLGNLLGSANVEATVRVKLDNDQYIYLGLAMMIGVLLGTLFGDMLKKMLGTN